MKIRRLAFASGVTAAALLLAACGSSPSTGFKDTAFVPLTQSNFGSVVSSSVKHVRSTHMQMTTSVFTMSGDFFEGPPIEMQMSIRGSHAGRTMTAQMRFLGTTMYMQIPGQTPAGKYMALDFKKIPQFARLLKVMDSYKKMGPQSFASQFRRISTLKYDGTAQIDGQSVRHYTVTINTADALKVLGMGGNTTLSSFASQLKTLTEQVYLADNHTLRRITAELPAPIGTMQVDFSKWGEPVHVVAPPASEVVPFPAGALKRG